MKKMLNLGLLVAGLALSGADQYKNIDTKDKLKDKDLLFAATFDRGTVNADFAKGDGFSTNMKNVGLLLRGMIGFDGKPAYRPEPGEDLMFDAVKNVNPHQGTVTMWLCCRDYNPSQPNKRGNIALLQMMFKQGQRHILMQFYECDELYFDWWSSEPPNTLGRVVATRPGIGKGQWHQIALTWVGNELAIYVNGKHYQTRTLPLKAAKTKDLKPEKGKSFIGIRKRFYGDTHKYDVAVDDVKIYGRAFSPIEVRNQYLRLVSGSTAEKIQDFGIAMNGVDRGPAEKKYDQIEAELDFSPLPDKAKELLKQGKLKLFYELAGPDGKKTKGSWTFGPDSNCRLFSGITKPGKYTLTAWMDQGSKVTCTIDRPDLSFIGNGYGDEEEVPALWKDFAVSGRTVTLWNRVYKFGQGPYPESITVKGLKLLDRAPVILVDGKAVTDWKAGKTEKKITKVIYTGTGKGKGFTLDYRTTVEYDGLITTVFRFHGKPEISSLKLNWQTAKDFRQFLMVPTVQENSTGKFEYLYPGFGGSHLNRGPEICKQLWLVSQRKGGFCYSMPHDANWIYDPEKPVFFADKNTGECTVSMVNKKVRLPEDTDYTSLFIATPTRPLIPDRRGLRFGDSLRADAKTVFGGGGKTGTLGVWNYEPDPPVLTRLLKNSLPKSKYFYGGAGALTEENPVAIYFRKYRNVPRSSGYRMPFHKPMPDGSFKIIRYNSVSTCNATSHTDYQLYGIKKLMEHPMVSKIWCIGFDLCGSTQCANELHGCAFKDKFGRTISSFTLLAKRNLVRRTVALAHRYGVYVYCHAQRQYMPVMHGLADLWEPGEDISNMALVNPYCVMDDISDARFRSEFNSDTLGTAVVMGPNICQQHYAYFKPDGFKYTIASIGMTQLYNIEISRDYLAGVPTRRMWDILENYNIFSPKTQCHLFYEQSEVTTSHPEVKVTWWKTPENRYMILLVNKDIRKREVTVDLTKVVGNKSFPAWEEYYEKPIKVTDGKFKTTVRSRTFQMIVFPQKKKYPMRPPMSHGWGNWTAPKRDTEFKTAPGKGVKGNTCLIQVCKATGTGCFTKSLPVTAGHTYVMKVMAKHSVPGEKVVLSLNGQIREAYQGNLSADTVEKATGEWQKLTLKLDIPADGKWSNCDSILVKLSGTGKNCTCLFDQFEIDEKELKK